MERCWMVLVLTACTGGQGSEPAQDAGLDVGGPDTSVPDSSPDIAPAVDAGPITVSGRVFKPFGIPAVGFRIAILRRADVVVTDDTGAFEFLDVAVPYTLVVLDDEDGRAFVWEDLTRPDPTVGVAQRIFDATAYLERRTAVAGVMAPGFPSSGRAVPVIGLQGASYSGSLVTSVGDFRVDDVRWHGAAEITATIHALHWSEGPADDLPQTYHGYGSTSGVLLTDGMATMDAEITLGPVAQGDVTVQAVPPYGWDPPATGVYLAFTDGAWIMLGSDPGSDITFAAPNLANARVAVRVNATLNGASAHASRVGVSPGDVVTLDLPAPPELLAPAGGAVDVATGTVFSWRPYPGVHILGLRSISEGPWITIFTRDASAAIPDLAPYGVSLPSGAPYGWSVSGLGGVTSTDDLAGAMPAPWTSALGQSHTEGTSVTRVFTID